VISAAAIVTVAIPEKVVLNITGFSYRMTLRGNEVHRLPLNRLRDNGHVAAVGVAPERVQYLRCAVVGD
jgi:hypothetical protein